MLKLFFKKINNFLHQLEEKKCDKLTDEIREYINENLTYVLNNPVSNSLIDAFNNEGDKVDEWYDNIYISLYLFYLTSLQLTEKNILYIGGQDKLNLLMSHVSVSVASHISFLSGCETNHEKIKKHTDELSSSNAPFIIYDPEGLKLFLSIDTREIICAVPLYDLLYASNIPISSKINNHTHFLAKKYCALADKNNNTVIIGNSYSLYGFPEQLLVRSVNISTHSLGLKQAQLLVEHIIVHYPHIDNFIFCVGFFDLYSDLLKTQDSFNQSIIVAFSQIVSHYGIKREYPLQSDEAIFLSRLLFVTSVRQQLPNIDNVNLRDDAYNSMIPYITSKSYLDKGVQCQTARQRATLHSNCIGHLTTLEENKKITIEINDCIAKKTKRSVWITPPFPGEYVKNINPNMKAMHRQFFTGLNDQHSHFIDLSENKNFRRLDYRDGDHLNYAGAIKLTQKLRKMNIAI